MKALDIKTNSLHTVISITGTEVFMESKKYGRTREHIENVILIGEGRVMFSDCEEAASNLRSKLYNRQLIQDDLQ